VDVLNIDCLEAAKALQDEGFNPVVLNMACATGPGGGYLAGAAAQEENLFRRSDYSKCATSKHYPIHKKVVYTSNVNVFRSSQATGYQYLPEVYRLSFVAAAAENGPRLVPTKGGYRLNSSAASALFDKIATLLSAAQQNEHDAVVLSALGCGAFRNPPGHVAEIFAKALSTPPFAGAFRRIVFAIFDDHNSCQLHNPKGNFQPFYEQFCQQSKAPPSRKFDEARRSDAVDHAMNGPLSTRGPVETHDPMVTPDAIVTHDRNGRQKVSVAKHAPVTNHVDTKECPYGNDCKYTRSCKYRHPEPRESATHCKYGSGCKHKHRCQYRHPELEGAGAQLPHGSQQV
jgi:uncharacterized protein (TIGR02452 family)